MKIILANFIHIYQPPTQSKRMLDKIVNESYWKILEILKNNPPIKINLNVAGCLLDLFAKFGHKKIIQEIKNLVQKDQIEFVSSAKYHAFLPLLPENEIKRQIELNEKTCKKFFGKLWNAEGFHIPEMAYSRKVAKIVEGFGYKWILANETSYNGKLFSDLDFTKTYKIKNSSLKIFFRDRRISDLFNEGLLSNTDDFLKNVQKEISPREYLILATDGEIYGHQRPGLENILAQIYRLHEVNPIFISKLPSLYPEEKEVKPVPSTWASMESEIKNKIYYAQWKYPRNPIHKMQWELTILAINAVENYKYKKSKDWKRARNLLDQGLHSCQYWWGSTSPWWDIRNIEAGAHQLIEAIQSLKMINKNILERGKNLYQKIIFTAFDWERSGRAHRRSIKYTEKIEKELYGEIRPATKEALELLNKKLESHF